MSSESEPSVPIMPVVGGDCQLDEVFRCRRDVLTHIANRITRNAADAEDVVQSAFLRAWESGMQLSPERLAYWLTTVVRRLSIDQLRRATTQKRYAEQQQHHEDRIDTWGGLRLTRAAKENLEALVAALPGALQETFRLWCAGASYESIALLQRIPIGTVASRILRARAWLQSRLRPRSDGTWELSQLGDL